MTRLHDNDIATMKLLQEELESLNARWKEARPYSQEVANLDASFKSWEKRLGRAVEAGLFQRILAAAHGVTAAPAPTAAQILELARQQGDEAEHGFIFNKDGRWSVLTFARALLALGVAIPSKEQQR